MTMTASIYRLKDQSAVLKAMAECDRLGRDNFLERYGYKRARRYVLKHGGGEYDSKAILGVAFKYAFGKALTPYDFSGGERTVWLVLTRMGFEVEGSAGLQVSPTALKPTSDLDVLQQRAWQLLQAAKKAKTPMAPPKGNRKPTRGAAGAKGFVRDPAVVAFVLSRADGTCEACQEPAPFKRVDGTPFLEVHHVRHLAEKGPDTHDNAVAVCPNCHRGLHFGRDRMARKRALYSALPALKKYP